ncbi:MAG: hypothetical protein ACRCTY_03030, partial [Candidatus Adiutrix sp.]
MNNLNFNWGHGLKIIRQGFDTWLFVCKLIIPALILTRFILLFDIIPYAAVIFEPLMALMGLPPEAALVWVSGMLGNLYVAFTVYVSLAPALGPLTVAQVTILGSMCLLAHALIIEGQVCRGAGLSFWRVTLFRIILAIFFGLISAQVVALTGWGASPAVMLNIVDVHSTINPPWGQWLISTAKQLIFILILIEVLMIFMELVKYFNLTRLIMKVLGPFLKLAGVGEKALMVTVFGCVLGLTYGGGLIIAESRSGHLSKQDIFGSMMLMAAFHSLFEDT